MNITELYKIYRDCPVICTDSRKISDGCLFFALKGTNFNGNDFAFKAIEAGASFAIVDEDLTEKSNKIIRVDNCLKTLQELARYHRQKSDVPVIALTGSNGKTTTKELCREVLSKKFNLHATAGNLNNHIGVPLTLLSSPLNTEMFLIEMGANHQGEIHDLCTIAEPDYGAITNIGKAHLEGFGGIEGVKKGKSEMYRFLAERHGSIFINEDDEVLKSLLPVNVKKIVYSTSRLCTQAQCNPHLSFILDDSNLFFQTQMVGIYNLDNIAMSVAMGRYFGIPDIDIRDAICSYVPQNNRSQIIETDNNTYLLDAYNANPSSMQASINSFSSSAFVKKVLVLGDMLELGNESQFEHEQLLKSIQPENWADVILIGPQFYEFRNKFPFQFFTDTEKGAYYLNSRVNKATVLLKGSRGMALERMIQQ